MWDFYEIQAEQTKRGIEVSPAFLIKKSQDLMIRGGDFYAVWLEDENRWSTDEQDVINTIDKELEKHARELRQGNDELPVFIRRMRYAKTGVINEWHTYCQKQMRQSYVPLDETIIFAGTELKKEDYATKTLPYSLGPGDISAYEELISTLYFPEERHKIEWAIGAVVSGDSKKIQKFLVLYGAGGTGKSTILNIIADLFQGYTSVFDAKALGSSNNTFALEAFRTNPLVAIQQDGDLSRIEDNTQLNSLVSHEDMRVNEKFKPTYSMRFNAFLFMGTNKPVRITDARSGLIRRLIDVSPSGNLIPRNEYEKLVKEVRFELGAIAQHCLDVYEENPGAYNDYVPELMLTATNDFYSFCLEHYPVFKKDDGTTMRAAWEAYKVYCDDAKVPYPVSQRIFKEELKTYFKDYYERYIMPDGTRVRSYYSGFKTDKFDIDEGTKEKPPDEKAEDWIVLKEQKSIFDEMCSGMVAQLAKEDGSPNEAWDFVKTCLRDISSRSLHYVRLPLNHIVIDFDIPDENGEKSLERNLAEANKWPPTYCELSKSGKGIHLHYFYTGNAEELNRVYDEHIEVKVFTGKSSLRRKLTLCNDIPIRTISSGLPMRGSKKVVDFEGIKSEMHLRALVAKNLRKEIHANTRPSMDLIYKSIESAYNSGLHYDISDMQNAVIAFAMHSTHQRDYCIKLESQIHYQSKEELPEIETSDDPYNFVLFDMEVFSNHTFLNWKVVGNYPMIRWIDPEPAKIEQFLKLRFAGFNNLDYDNHMIWSCYIGESTYERFMRSQKVINSEKKYTENESRNARFFDASKISYTDIYDFSSKKQSLKKWEIELKNVVYRIDAGLSIEDAAKERGISIDAMQKVYDIMKKISHKELNLPWDKPVPEDKLQEVSEYCDNDVYATEAVFWACEADWTARQILADIAGMSVNTRTNALSAKIIFNGEKHPQSQFNYRDMGAVPDDASTDVVDENMVLYKDFVNDGFTLFDKEGRPVFPGYSCGFEDIVSKKGIVTGSKIVSRYRGEEVGEGGYVYAEPGMYTNVALLDIASMHPSSAIAENLFGPYTKNFAEIKQTRVDIKHGDFETAAKRFDGKLTKYLSDKGIAKKLAYALKIVINSVYGCTKAGFENPFRDPRNVDNIVAKRGALFMVNLKHAVQDRGFTVAHIKTDSIKIPNATPEIIQFVMDYGKMYGYTFEHEATYERMCLVNDSVYIAKYAPEYEDGAWTATGTQFQIPYVFKTCFTHEPIVFSDMCETKSVSSALYLDMNEDLHEDEHNYIFVGKVGQFCPIKEGSGGGLLMRKAGDNSYASATGAKGYRWLESETIRVLDRTDIIDRSYYDTLVNKAVDTISEFGDYEWFVNTDSGKFIARNEEEAA